ncbi:head GIN domain-containing protein [Massilia endophytica]|uniref:head GIN domain-containing protein n=1 Tax=Massilia endophytica TaxID=2899220 RepID=UPI001E46EB1C|nr:head GIN domain-containing protein [Massilia endophytica]UGQ48350.1 DUF2807 domain-containing protein [Massilia endophytica]
MRLSHISAAVLALALGGCVIVVPENGKTYSWSSSAVQGNGSMGSETRIAAGTTGLEVESRRRIDMDVEVQVGPVASLQIEGDSNLLPLVRTEVSGGNMRIVVDQELRSAQPLRVRYTTPRLTKLETSGISRATVNGLNGGPLSVEHNGSGRTELRGRVDQLDARNNGSGSLVADALDAGTTRLALHGSGRISLGNVHGEQLMARVHGSGNLSAAGEVRNLDVSVNGSGDARLSGLRSERADLTTNGSGDIVVAVSSTVRSSTNGSGKITVYGNPSERFVTGKRTTFVQ